MKFTKEQIQKISGYTKTGGDASEKQVAYLNNLLGGHTTVEFGKIGKAEASALIDHVRIGMAHKAMKAMIKSAIVARMEEQPVSADAKVFMSLRGYVREIVAEMGLQPLSPGLRCGAQKETRDTKGDTTMKTAKLRIRRADGRIHMYADKHVRQVELDGVHSVVEVAVPGMEPFRAGKWFEVDGSYDPHTEIINVGQMTGDECLAEMAKWQGDLWLPGEDAALVVGFD